MFKRFVSCVVVLIASAGVRADLAADIETAQTFFDNTLASIDGYKTAIGLTYYFMKNNQDGYDTYGGGMSYADNTTVYNDLSWYYANAASASISSGYTSMQGASTFGTSYCETAMGYLNNGDPESAQAVFDNYISPYFSFAVNSYNTYSYNIGKADAQNTEAYDIINKYR